MPSATTHESTAIQHSHKVDSSSSSFYSNPTSSSMIRESSSTSTLPPAPPPMPPSCALPPPPPPLLGGLRNPLRPESAPPTSRLTPRVGPDESSTAGQLPQQRTPLPKTQMKRLQWNKIPVNRVASSPGNLWIEVAGMCNGRQLNFERMEELFANAGNGGAPVCSGGSGSAGSKGTRELPVPEGSICERKTKKMDEINLIDSKRSMNVNIFLRQFRTSNIDIVKCLRSGNSQLMGPERLRRLIKVLPEPEDVQLLSAFAGDRTLLGSAEKFYLELIALPNHRFLAEALLMKEEFSQTIDYVKPAIDAIILSARDIKDSKALHEILYTVLMAGNFLNSGVYSGNAAGFQLQSLLKLSELRANKPRMNLLHFVAQEIETHNPHLIDKLKKLKYLAEASHYSIEALLNDISTLQNRVRTISNQISIAEQHFQRQMKDFLEMALGEMEVLEMDMRELEDLRMEFANYLCEDPQTFKLDDCLSTFNTFCKMFHKALEENRERHLQDLRAEERRRLREEQIASKRRSMTLDESQSRRSPDGSAALSSPDVDTVDCVGQRNIASDNNRRIQISQKMPAFLIETSQDSSRESSPCPGGVTTTTTAAPNNRHKKRNSMSNFFRNDSRKMLPQTPGDGESISVDRDNDLIDVLLKSASAVEDSDRSRPGSGSVRQRRRSRASIDILDRERAPSPSPLNASVPHMETGSATDGGTGAANDGKDQLDRGQPGRSSCPSRISSAQGRKQQLLKDALLNQHAASDANGTDGQTEESGGSCPSDAEVSAKQERENRRMERRRRSRVNSSVSSCDAKSTIIGVEQTTSQPASAVTSLSQSTGSDLNSTNRNSGQEDRQPLSPRGKSATETRPTVVETQTETAASNLVTCTSTSSADQFLEDAVKSRTTTATTRRDAAKIRSLGDQRRWSSELERLSTGAQRSLSSSNNHETGSDAGKLSTAGTVAKGASEHSIHQTTHGKTMTTHGKTIRRASAEQEAAVHTAPPRKVRLNNLVTQHSIPEQRISAGTKLNSGSHKNIANAKGTQKNENVSKNLGRQSDDRDSDENFAESTHLFNGKSVTGDRISEALRLKETVGTESDGATTTKVDHAHHSEASALNSQEGCSSQGPDAEGDQRKRWGKVFENEETEDPDSASRETVRSQVPDEERDQEGKEDEEEAGCRAKESTLQSATVRDYGDLVTSSTAVERASTRKEKLRKLSQLYSVEDDVDVPRTGDVGTAGNTEEAVVPRVTDTPATRTHSRESAADQKSDTDSFYSARDEGFESEGHSLCSASQRTSMSSTAESDIRITPLMTRKTYPAGGEKEEVGTDAETSSALLLGRTSIDSVVSASRMDGATAVSPRPDDKTRRTSSAVNRSLTKTTVSSKATLGGSRELHTTDKTGFRKGLSKAIERPKVPTTHSATIATTANRILPKSVPSPRNVASSNAVQYRIAKPNMVAVSRTPTPRAAKTSPDKTLTSSTSTVTKQSATPAATMGRSPPMKTETKPKAIRRLENRVTPAATIAGEKSLTQGERPIQFVRGVGVRATVPVDVLRENKRAAIESRQVRNIAATPTPPRRTTSLHDANNTPTAGAQKTNVPALHPRKPSASAAGLPAIDHSEARLDASASEGKSSTRKASSELRMPLSSRSDRSKAASRIPDSARRISVDPSMGDGRLHPGVTTATAGMSRQSTTTPVVSVQAKVIHVATLRSKASSAVSERGKSRMPTSKTVSVSSLA